MNFWQARLARRALVGGGVVMHATEGVWGLACDPRCARAASWPGAVTWILPNRQFPEWITGGRSSVAVRVPDHAQARALVDAFGAPLVSTSANRSGRPPPRNRFQARSRYFALRDHAEALSGAGTFYFLPGETAGRRGPSEIRTVAGAVLRGNA